MVTLNLTEEEAHELRSVLAGEIEEREVNSFFSEQRVDILKRIFDKLG